MLRSMTGYGRSQTDSDGVSIKVEIKSVNHRFLELIIKIPRKYLSLEEKIKSTLQKSIHRGRIEVWVHIDDTSTSGGRVKVDKELAMDYHNSLKELAKLAGISYDLDIFQVSRLEGVLSLVESDTDTDRVWKCLEKPLCNALEQVVSMREIEGAKLRKDLEDRAVCVRELVAGIEKRSPEVVDNYRHRFTQRVLDLLGEGMEVDETRLLTEIAVIAEKSDITEEVVRLRSHLGQLMSNLDQSIPVGRKLDFIMQEMHREINTIGSKSPDITLSQKVVDVKAEIEKMREQVQNIE